MYFNYLYTYYSMLFCHFDIFSKLLFVKTLLNSGAYSALPGGGEIWTQIIGSYKNLYKNDSVPTDYK